MGKLGNPIFDGRHKGEESPDKAPKRSLFSLRYFRSRNKNRITEIEIIEIRDTPAFSRGQNKTIGRLGWNFYRVCLWECTKQ